MTTSNKSAILIDLASLQAVVAARSAQIDFRRLRDRLTGDATLVRATAYGIEHDGQPVPLVESGMMSGAGYKVVTKGLRRRDDGTLHASVHVEMTVDALDLTPHVDRLTLVTTDPDFVPLIEAVQRRGVRVQVVADGQGRGQELSAAADDTLALDEILGDVVQREGPRRDRRRPMPSRAAPRETARAPVPERPDGSAPSEVRMPPEPSRPSSSESPPQPSVEPPPAPTPELARRKRRTKLPEERLSGRAARRPDDES